MKIDLSGKTALVTGSTSGIGHAIARGLAGAGAEVTINGRSQAKVDAAVAAIAKAVPGAKARGVAADVSTAEGCKVLVAALPEVDILINNAGIFEPKPFFDIPDAEMKELTRASARLEPDDVLLAREAEVLIAAQRKMDDIVETFQATIYKNPQWAQAKQAYDHAEIAVAAAGGAVNGANITACLVIQADVRHSFYNSYSYNGGALAFFDPGSYYGRRY